MITDEKIYTLYDGIINGVVLTTKQLVEFKFSSKDINELIAKGFIKKLNKGYYVYIAVDTLFHYGKKLVVEKEYEKANICFKRCYELNNEHLGTCFQLFFRNISQKNYDKAFEFFEILKKSDNVYYQLDYNYYLYLLSIITEIPEKYNEQVRNFTINDIKVSPLDKRYKDYALQNKIRINALKRGFAYALQCLKDLTEKHSKISLQDKIARVLLFQAATKEAESKTLIINMIKQRRYADIIVHLQNKQRRHNLSDKEKYILKLTNAYIKIFDTRIIPQIKSNNSKTLYDAINNNDYNLALTIRKRGHINNELFDKGDILYMILIDICNLTDYIQNGKNSKTKEEDLLNTFKTYLMENDIDNAINIVNEYLLQIDKKEYSTLLLNLIKISALEGDLSFSYPLEVLHSIKTHSYVFDVSLYVQKFYTALSENNFSLARLYLDILANSKSFGFNLIMFDKFEQILTLSEQLQVKNEEEKRKKTLLKELIDREYSELINKNGIIILDRMDEDEIKNSLEIIDKYEDIIAFTIGNDSEKKIVLRYRPKNIEYIDIKELISSANKDYDNAYYDNALEKYLQALQVIKSPNSFLYARVGLTYLRKQNKEEALKFLTIAQDLAINEHKGYDYSALIAKLKNDNTIKTKKHHLKITQNDFDEHDVNNYYGINFEEINDYIMTRETDVDSACEELNLTMEQIDIVKLIYAKIYYMQGNFNKGDIFLKSVESNKEKTNLTKKILSDIRQNKKLYQHRESIAIKELKLTLMPRKK